MIDDPGERDVEQEGSSDEMPDPAEEAAGGSDEVHTGPPNPPESDDD